VDPFLISTWIGFIGTFPPLFFSIAHGTLTWPSLSDGALIFLIGVLSLGTQCCNTIALKVAQRTDSERSCQYTSNAHFSFLVRLYRRHDSPHPKGRSHPSVIYRSNNLFCRPPNFVDCSWRSHHCRLYCGIRYQKHIGQKVEKQYYQENVMS
jgi:hypothetical protein